MSSYPPHARRSAAMLLKPDDDATPLASCSGARCKWRPALRPKQCPDVSLAIRMRAEHLNRTTASRGSTLHALPAGSNFYVTEPKGKNVRSRPRMGARHSRFLINFLCSTPIRQSRNSRHAMKALIHISLIFQCCLCACSQEARPCLCVS